MINLIKLEDDKPVYNAEARTIKEFRAVIERDRGSKGDNDGRKKLMALKELAFVYYYCDYRSPFVCNFEEDVRIKEIKEAIGLDESWKLDKVVNEACDKYREYQETPTMKVLSSIKNSLFSAQKVIILVEKRLSSRIKEIEEDENLLDSNPELLDKVISDADRLNALANKVPLQIETLKKLEDKVKSELESEQFGRAGRKINTHELPN